MACDATGMDHIRARQTLLGEEPIYCAAYDDNEDILYLGADESLSHQARVARRLRYEDQALRYLRGQRPRLLSAALQGPFDRASGWRNPWLAQHQASKTRETIQDHLATDIPTQQPTRTAAVAKTASRVEPEMLGAKAHRTPATKNSVKCHLPSPDSYRELELADDPQFDFEARSRIQAWARNIPTDTLERDEFWAPDDGTGSVSDTSVVPKRPAGKEWLRSKLNKRRRTGDKDFATLATPTPGSFPAIVASTKSLRESQISMTANNSFEHTTPASSAGQNIEEPSQRSTSRKAVDKNILASKNEPSKYNVAVKASALRKAVIKPPRRASKTSSRNVSNEWLRVLPTENAYLVNAPVLQSGSQIVPTSSNAHAELRDNRDDNREQNIPPEQYDNGLESHLDRSFQYKARTTKHDAPKLANESVFTRQSQPTQTGTPESEDHEKLVSTQHQVPGDLDIDHDNLMHQTLGQIEELSNNHSEGQQDDHQEPQGSQRIIDRSSDANDQGHGKMGFSDLAGNPTCSGTTLPENGVASDHIQDDAPQPSPAPHGHHSTSNGALINPKDSNAMFQSTSREHLTEATMNEDSTPFNDRVVNDANTTCQLVKSADRLENIQGSKPDSKEPKVIKSHFTPTSRPKASRPVSEPPLNFDATNIPVRAFSHFESANTSIESVERHILINFDDGQPKEQEEIQHSIERQSFTAVAETTLFIASQPSPSAQPVSTTADETAPQENPQFRTTNENTSDNVSDTGHSLIMVPLSQAEWAITETTDAAKPIVKEAVLQPDTQSIKIEPATEPEGVVAVSDGTSTLQNSCVAGDCAIKDELVEEEEQVSCLQPINLTSSPTDVGQERELPPLQQGFWDCMNIESDQGAGLQTSSRLLQHSIVSGLSPSQLPEKQQSPWKAPTNLMNNADRGFVSHSSQHAHLQPSAVNEFNSPNTMLQQASKSSDLALEPIVPETARHSISFDQPGATFQFDARRPTPEPNLSIKSFATFNTPSPKRRRASKHRIASGDRLPSTQLLTNAVNNNPWGSVRSSFRSSVGSRSQLRVSFAPLPDEDDDGDSSDNLLRSTTRTAASPPPQSTPALGDEDSGDHFQKHFDAVRHKSATNQKTVGLGLAQRLLPNESQQVPLSPEIGMMAQAFKEADVVPRLKSSPEPAIIEDDVPYRIYDESNARLQSPWRIESQSEGVDDVTDVLQNLDDYLNPPWDVEAELGKAQGMDGIENQRRERSPGLFEDNVWA